MDEPTQSTPDTTDVPEVDSTPLDINDDLFDVKRELTPVVARWKDIGIALRLNPAVLGRIEAGHSGDPVACLTSVGTEWLKRNYNVNRFGEPTWKRLAEAVGDPAGGANMALARNIARRHKVKSGTNETDTGEIPRKCSTESGTNMPAIKKAKVEAAESQSLRASFSVTLREFRHKHAAESQPLWASLSATLPEFRHKLKGNGYLNGLDVIGETNILVTNQAQTFQWEGYGLKLHIPKGALPAGLKECKVFIKVGLSGQFTLPRNTLVVSAVYCLDTEPKCKFSQPLSLEMQHCAESSFTSKLSFARCSQNSPPYTFEILEGGEFSGSSSYGCIQLHSFSLFTQLLRGLARILGHGEEPVKYHARLYYMMKGEDRREIHFLITEDLDTHATEIQQKYAARGATIGPDLPVEFESDSISLELPSENDDDGWNVDPLFPPVVKIEESENPAAGGRIKEPCFTPGSHSIVKNDVDRCIARTGHEIPHCQLTAEWTKQDKPSRLKRKVTLKGAKEPYNYFLIVIDPTPVTPPATQIPAVDSTPLDLDDDFYDVKRELTPVAAKWKDIGIALRLKRDALDRIEAGNVGNPTACLTSMATEWLMRNYNVEKFGEPTWKRLVEAVDDSAGGNNKEHARNIARRHKAKSGANETGTGELNRKRKARSRTNMPATKMPKVGDSQQSSRRIPSQKCDSKSPITTIQQESSNTGAHDTSEGQPATTAVNEECVKEIKKLVRKRPLVLVTAGIPGAGKSTLVNNLLGLKGEEAAKTKSVRKSVTRSIGVYEGEIHGVSLRIIDMPGFEATDQNSMEEEEEEEEELARLSDLTNGKADLLLYCMKMTDKSDYRDERIVRTLTETFGKEIWRHTILVLTFGDVLNHNRSLVEEFTEDFEKALKKVGVIDVPVTSILSTPNIKSDADVQQPEIIGVPVGRYTQTPPNWTGLLIKEIIKKCTFDAIPAMLVLQGMQPGWVAVLMRGGELGKAAASWAIVGVGAVLGAVLDGSILARSGWGIEQLTGLANIIKARENKEAKKTK